MYHILFIFCLINIITLPNLSAMDFDLEKNIPLIEIWNAKKNTQQKPQKTLLEQLRDFDQKIHSEYGGNGTPIKKKLNDNIYIAALIQEVPAIVQNKIIIKQLAREESYFGRTIKNMIRSVNEWNSEVTGETLHTINNPSLVTPLMQPFCYPYEMRKYAIRQAYDNLNNETKPWMIFPEDTVITDIHDKIELVGTIDRRNKKFRVFNLVTRCKHISLNKKAKKGWLKFSNNGSYIISISLQKEEPQEIHIDIWDSLTTQLLHTITHPTVLTDCSLDDDNKEASLLHIFDMNNYLFVYALQKDAPAQCLVTTKMNMCLKDQFTAPGIYTVQHTKLFKKNCPAYVVCGRAAKNTQEKTSLEKIAQAPLYQLLTPAEKEIIDNAILSKNK